MRFEPRPLPTEQLIAMYRSGMSLEKISAQVPLTAGGVRMRLIRAGVKLRPKNQGMIPTNKNPIETSALIAMYQQGKPAHVIGRVVGLTATAVISRLKRAGFARRARGDYEGKSGASNPNWRGGRWMRDDGYVFVAVPGQRAAFEHRVVMERIVGRKLATHEHVHHINGIRGDNRPENLAITTSKTHESRTLIKALQQRIRELESQLRDHQKPLPSASGIAPNT